MGILLFIVCCWLFVFHKALFPEIECFSEYKQPTIKNGGVGVPPNSKRDEVLRRFCMKHGIFLLVAVAVASLLTSCTGSARLLEFPFDPAGRSLNSPLSELTPQVTGRYIVFISERRGSQDVYLYDATTRSLIDLPGLNALDAIASHPAVSEDGQIIVFAATRQGRSGIYLYNRETRQLRNITENLQAEVRNPTISTDGSTIAFESSKNGQWDILVYDRSGKPLDLPTLMP
jgi:Tol biopolymer transport system component